jgi:hypothetical protein
MLTGTAALLFNSATITVTGRGIDSVSRAFAGKVHTASGYLQQDTPLTVCTLAVIEAAL